jgi:hypothetical protein
MFDNRGSTVFGLCTVSACRHLIFSGSSVSALHKIFNNFDSTEIGCEHSFHVSPYPYIRSSVKSDEQNAVLKQAVGRIFCHIYVVGVLFINNIKK